MNDLQINVGELQLKVNDLAQKVRLQTIEFLIKEDIFKYNGKQMNDENLNKMVEYVDRIHCCTALMRGLFEDAHKMHEDKDLRPHCVSVADLEWCMKNRCIGYSSTQSVPRAWIPKKEDTDLRRLPAFRELTLLYKPMIESGKRILPPVYIPEGDNEAMEAVKRLRAGLMLENRASSDDEPF